MVFTILKLSTPTCNVTGQEWLGRGMKRKAAATDLMLLYCHFDGLVVVFIALISIPFIYVYGS